MAAGCDGRRTVVPGGIEEQRGGCRRADEQQRETGEKIKDCGKDV